MLAIFMNALQARLAEVKDEEGQGLVEYSLIAALISVVAIVIMTQVGQDVIGVFTAISTALQSAL